VDAIVEMNPYIWSSEGGRAQRSRMGSVISAGEAGAPQWQPAPPIPWDYTVFGGDAPTPEPDGRLTLVFRSTDDGHHWMINGKSHPRNDDIVVEANRRYRWLLDNQSAHPHPIHLHRHAFELVRYVGAPSSGIWKDVIVVPAWQQVEIDVHANQPGLSLFHCHQQFHMDMGLMAMMRYSS
jgi:FtsP/CotA-like multicopper oxidase with cupredoxin domain